MSPCQMGSGLLEEDMAVTSFSVINKSPSLHAVRWAFFVSEIGKGA
jgi:hypothetical protein